MNAPSPRDRAPAPAGALHRAVWRWHFFAGLFVAPFAVVLAVTGALYLWKPQFEEWKYRDLFNVAIPAAATPLSADAQFAAGRAACPQLNPTQFIPAARPGRSAELQFGAMHGPKRISVFIHPYTGAILGQIDDATRLMSILHNLHRTLLAGRPGELLVELATSWAIVLLASGLYLWWPRPFTVRGFLLPRFGLGRRALLRDLHAVPAVWLSGFTLLLLVTGIQRTPVGGQWSRTLAQAVGEWQPAGTQASVHRSAPPVAGQVMPPGVEAGEHRRMLFNDDPRRVPLEHIVAIAAERNVADAYAIALPQGPAGIYSIFSDRNRAFTRAYIHLDQYSGAVLADVRYKDFGYIGKFSTLGIIAHKGQLFGLANQVLGLLTCLGLIGLTVTGVMMWWSRRPAGQLAAPSAQGLCKVSRGAGVLAVVLAALLPLMAATLVLLVLFDLFLGRRLPWLQPAAR